MPISDSIKRMSSPQWLWHPFTGISKRLAAPQHNTFKLAMSALHSLHETVPAHFSDFICRMLLNCAATYSGLRSLKPRMHPGYA